MNDLDLLRPPGRRDVKSMTAELTGLKAGDHISVTMRLDKYGVVNVQGQACWSNTVKNFFVGGLPIESGLKPDKSVLSLVVSATAPGESETTARTTSYGDFESVQALAENVGHGDVVRATFEQKPYGQFTVTGVAVQTPDKAVTAVGTLFIAHRTLVGLEVLGTAATFNLLVPKPLVWDTDQAAAG